jgi:hypothetical protein
VDRRQRHCAGGVLFRRRQAFDGRTPLDREALDLWREEGQHEPRQIGGYDRLARIDRHPQSGNRQHHTQGRKRHHGAQGEHAFALDFGTWRSAPGHIDARSRKVWRHHAARGRRRRKLSRAVLELEARKS